ncbi:FMN-binding protein [Thiohalobacter sp. IOR34]|uniref:FMN-binding protein n=1 Tax=Thiohalobacter sp. IOR34 TaxID=3057176 RepID=UPI0025B11F3E|nr:FMN-binding protein [Thiohalobacter sp. IOR34]WJW75141.1 FMN-binding protein [Thiohalobacter sp. IOR34]
MQRLIILPLLWLLLTGLALARGTYQTPGDFIDQAFDGDPPRARVLWLKGALRKEVEDLLGHRYPSLRIRYWARGARSAWILDEIGKDEPITVGVVVDTGRIDRLRVLVFRESRGDEVRHPFFTRQFEGAALDGRQRLDRGIDNISGATLSVRALKKLARLALLLDRWRNRQAPEE